MQFSWRYECYWVLLWAPGFIEALNRPDEICDVMKAVGILHDNGRLPFPSLIYCYCQPGCDQKLR